MINNKVDQIKSKFINKYEKSDHFHQERLFTSSIKKYIKTKNSQQDNFLFTVNAYVSQK